MTRSAPKGSIGEVLPHHLSSLVEGTAQRLLAGRSPPSALGQRSHSRWVIHEKRFFSPQILGPPGRQGLITLLTGAFALFD